MKPEPSLRFPVVCPICAKEQLATFSIATLTRGLLSGNRFAFTRPVTTSIGMLRELKKSNCEST